MSSTADANSYPSKRPRLSAAPDINSFSVIAAPKKVTYKPPAANFQSAFQTGEPKGPIDDDSPEKKKPKAFRTMKPPTLALGLSGPSASPGNTPRKAGKKVGGRAVQLTSATTTSPTRPRVKPRSESSAATHAARNPPPQPTASSSKLPAQPNVGSKTKSLRHAPPPPVPKVNVHAKPAVLKSLQAPKLQEFETEPSPSKGLRTISTTHIARATDINSDGGAASLFSISLQGREDDGADDGLENEMRRGIGLSPVKAGRNKARGFARNGLAERASTLLSRSQTAYTLWHKEVSSAVNPASTSAAPRRVVADMDLLVVRILHETPITHHSPRKPRLKPRHNIPATLSPGPVIAVCRVLRVSAPPSSSSSKFPSLSPEELPAGVAEPEVRAGQVYPVVFSSLGGKVREGEKVGVWRPWHGIDLPVRGGAIAVVEAEEEGEDSFWGGPVIAERVEQHAQAPMVRAEGGNAAHDERAMYAKTLVCPRSLLVGS